MAEWSIFGAGLMGTTLLSTGAGIVLSRYNNLNKATLKNILCIVLCISPFCLGIFHVWTSAVLSVCFLFILSFYKEKIKIQNNFLLVSTILLPLTCILVAPFAIDRGMSMMGFVKFLPIPLFSVLAMQLTKDEREQLLQLLPLVGVVMTLLSAILSFIPLLQKFFLVNNRLAGFFQYPNVFAMYLLCGFLCVPKNQNWTAKTMWAVRIVLIAGILFSGSRTVLGLLIVAMILEGITKNKKYFLQMVCLLFLVSATFVFIMIILGKQELLMRYLVAPFQSSTFLGRLLYAADVLPVILAHPFGLGYGGYYYLQGSFQTGIYSTRFVHNELLQLLVDIGWIPAICWVCVVYQAFKKAEYQNRIFISVMVLHCLFDFDFQFIAIDLVFVLLLDFENGKKKLDHSNAIAHFVLAGIVVFIGIVDFLFQSGNYSLVASSYPIHTENNILLLTQAKTTQEMEECAKRILKGNTAVSLAYGALSAVEFEKGNGLEMINYQKKAIQFAPYSQHEYDAYFQRLFNYYNLYEDSNMTESMEYCRQALLEIPEMMEKKLESTSVLGWHIYDKPNLKLTEDQKNILEQLI